MMDQDLAYTSATDIAAAIRSKEISPREVLEFFIKRIEARNPSLNALVFTAFDEARTAAKLAEEAVMRGDSLMPLHGVPIAIKDLFDFKPGWPATFGGIRALKDFKTDFHCGFSERIEQRGGAIIVGKTNSPIMGFRGICDNYLFGPTCNPFDMRKNSGGSSGGSAAAVADGLLPFAEGTDGGGSIRIPASWCGVYGYKPSFGRAPVWSRPNAFAMEAPFIAEGPITRTVKDAAAAMSVLSGFDARDPFSYDAQLDFVAATRQSIKGMRIAYSPNFDVFPVEPEVAAIVKRALEAFEEAGAHLQEVKLGITRSQKELSDLWCRLIMPLNISGLLGMKAIGYDLLGKHRNDFPPEYLKWIDACMDMTAVEFFNDQAMRSEIYDAIQGVFQNHDLLVTPTLACLPVENATNGNTVGPSKVAGEAVDPLIGWCLTYPLNFSGNPAASIPAGLSASGMPVGMQIIGGRHADLTVIAASAEFERLRPWEHIYEKCRQRPIEVGP
jgi:amidase/aspartyl-tRNA(Asn)/glutamyl-tRNA(Gln) amidotransferase subunit A